MATRPYMAPEVAVTYVAPTETKLALRHATAEVLFDAAIRLTHQIRSVEDLEVKADLRKQRGLIRLELIARAKGGVR